MQETLHQCSQVILLQKYIYSRFYRHVYFTSDVELRLQIRHVLVRTIDILLYNVLCRLCTGILLSEKCEHNFYCCGVVQQRANALVHNIYSMNKYDALCLVKCKCLIINI